MKLILSTALLSTALHFAQASTLRNCDTREPYVYVAHYSGALTYEEHEAHAATCGGHVASVTNIDEFDQINDLIKSLSSVPSNGYEKERWWIGASREWQNSITTEGFSWSDGSEWDLFNSALTKQIGARTGSLCFLYNDLYPSNRIYTQYEKNDNDELEYVLWSAATEIPDIGRPAVYLLPSSYTENGDCDATDFYGLEEPEAALDTPEAALDTCTRCSDAVGVDVEADSHRLGHFGIYGDLSCSLLTENNAENFCASPNDDANDLGIYDDSLEEGKYFWGELFRQLCPYKCKKWSSVTTCQAEDFLLEFSVVGQEERLSCDMVANDLDLCEDDAIWWTCPQTCYNAGTTSTDEDTESSPTESPTESPTASPTKSPTDMDCDDKSKKEFEIAVDGAENYKTKNCAWLETKKNKKKKQFCKQKVQINGNNKKLHTICKNTCGLVGKGDCSHLKDQQ